MCVESGDLYQVLECSSSALSLSADKTCQICEKNQLFEMGQDNQINSSEEKSENKTTFKKLESMACFITGNKHQ